MEITDAIAEGLLRTVIKNTKILHTDPSNYEARAEIMWAGSLAHNGLTGCGNDGGDFMSHKLEHEIGGMRRTYRFRKAAFSSGHDSHLQKSK